MQTNIQKHAFPHKNAIIAFGILLFVGFSWIGYWSIRGFFEAKQVFSSAVRFSQAVAAYDLTSAEFALQDLQEGSAFFSETFPLFRIGKHLPFLDNSASLAQEGVGALAQATASADVAFHIAHNINDAVSLSDSSESFDFFENPRSYAELSVQERRALVNALAKSAPDLQKILLHIGLLREHLDVLIEQKAPFYHELDRVRTKILQVEDALSALAPIMTFVQELGGVLEPRETLILYLNNGELRPGGGFIGAYSIMKVDAGTVSSFVTQDSYAPDAYVLNSQEYAIASPGPFAKYMGIPVWYFRDAAWSPDFLETADTARMLLRQELAYGGVSVPYIHEVIGITPDAVEDLFSLLGDITIEGKTYTAKDVYDILQHEVEIDYVNSGKTVEERKAALAKLADAVLDRMLLLQPREIPELFSTIHRSLEKKHIILMSTNEDFQKVLEASGWAGRVSPSSGEDALMLVDANLGSLKTDKVMHRDLSYKLTPTPTGDMLAEVSVVYTHEGGSDWRTTGYASYTRLLVPLGSRLVDVVGYRDGVQEGSELGMTSFGGYFVVDPGTQKTITYRYILPQSILESIHRGTYRLTVIDQIGGGDNPLTLNLDFATNLTSANPPEDEEYWGDTLYTTSRVPSGDLMVTLELE